MQPEMRITPNGEVGVGTLDPAHELSVAGAINASGDINSSSDICIEGGNCLSSVGGGASWWTNSSGDATYTNGNVGGGTTSPSTKLDVDGTITGNTKNFKQSINSTHKAVYTSQESPMPRAVFENTTSVTNGTAVVELPKHFSGVASDTEPALNVQVTPMTTDTYGLAVTNASTSEITVEDLMNGTHSFSFHYRVTAVRDGYENKTVVRE
jgi:hypothetical protein